ncbi:MAG: pseudaminic acid biosynthesis-associated methylase [Pseudomonadota bacterium]
MTRLCSNDKDFDDMPVTQQEAFWSGEHGDTYTRKNSGPHVGSQIHFFSDILRRVPDVGSVYEVGANAGLNLDAIKALNPAIEIAGCDINEQAVGLSKAKGYDIDLCSIFEIGGGRRFDLVFTRGVLVHINPDRLPDVYDRMGQLSAKYILIDEFFSPVPVPIDNYMGQNGVLFKRDFGREIMDRLGLNLLAYGFRSKIDPVFPGYDTNWYLFQK